MNPRVLCLRSPLLPKTSSSVTRIQPIVRLSSEVSVTRRRVPQPALYQSARWYSSATEETATPASDANVAAEAKPAEAVEDPLKKKIEAQEKEIIEMKDKYLRSVADFRNLQERTKRDISAARDFAISKFAKDLLDSVDNLDRALDTVPAEALASEANKDLVNLHSGLKMTEQILMQTLGKHGLARYDPAESGDKFDPNIHEAAFMAPSKDKEDGAVLATMQKGFRLNGRVIRAAKVGVVKNS